MCKKKTIFETRTTNRVEIAETKHVSLKRTKQKPPTLANLTSYSEY